MKPLEKHLIVCEGAVTEPTYFDSIRKEKRLSRNLITIVAPAGVPMTLVKRAALLKKENDATSARNPLLKFTNVWCVFDKDEHPSIPEAIELAKAEGLNVVFTNPCFELFLLFHFADCNRDEHRNDVSRLLRGFVADYEKSFDYVALDLHSRYADAKQRCVNVNSRSEIVDDIQAAPYCEVPDLVDVLRALPDSPYKRG